MLRRTLLFFICSFCFTAIHAQQITGVWRGKIDRKNVEVKIIQNGDSLTGTSYYYTSKNAYRRYAIKGYFDAATNSAVWWDDVLLEEKSGLLGVPGKVPQLAVADFNCPGGGQMFLEGKATPKDEPEEPGSGVDLAKVAGPNFTDEWDFLIDNYTSGTNDPFIIDSVSLVTTAPRNIPVIPASTKPIVAVEPPVAVVQEPVKTTPAPTSDITEKFTIRKKIFAKEIPVEGEIIELRFYDNAQVDGDSISLFLDGKLLFEHIRLTEQAYTITLPVADLKNISELTMVAENLGSIPPNTSFMVALVGSKRYEAKLSSTENISALIRLKKGSD